MNIGRRLFAARKAAQMTLQELASVLGVSHTAIAKYEKGLRLKERSVRPTQSPELLFGKEGE